MGPIYPANFAGVSFNHEVVVAVSSKKSEIETRGGVPEPAVTDMNSLSSIRPTCPVVIVTVNVDQHRLVE